MIKWVIVDDDVEDQEIFEIALHEVDSNIELVKFTNGIHAIELLKKSDVHAFPKCIFLDLNMPQMDGRECITELKNIKEVKNIPVYIYSTSSDSKDIKQLTELGAERFITKPDSLPELISVLKEVASK